MRILYGVVGEGMGHATRSRVILEQLSLNHEIQIVASGRAMTYLQQRFPSVHPIWGYTIAYEGNSVKAWQTLVQNLKGAVRGWPQNIRQYFEIARSFKPNVVISDFESFSYLFAKRHSIPVISADNMQIIDRCQHARSLWKGFEFDFQLSRAIVSSKLPRAFHYLITTFFYPPVRKKRTTLLPPLLRPEVLSARSEVGDHLLVYQTATTNVELPAILMRSQVECRVYGLRRDLAADQVDENLIYRPFDEGRFIDDLRTARGVIAGGGFTLMSEAVHLRKPMLAIPLAGQFEQTLNALYLQQLGYGAHAAELTDEALGAFLQQQSGYRESLEAYRPEGNERFLAALEEQLAAAVDS
jgi:uncharacterized protein (TIGR00661 family)